MVSSHTYPPAYAGSSATTPSSKPQWLTILEALATEKHVDLHPATPELWKARLRNYNANEIKRALLSWRGPQFVIPDSDSIIEIIEGFREQGKVKREFEACGLNGCVNGWRPVSSEKFARYQRCQCLLDHIRLVKGK